MTFAEYATMSSSSGIVLFEIDIGGTTVGYAKKDFTPVGSSIFYEGRLNSVFDIGYSRDPLTWGKLSFPTGSVDLNNGDGHFNASANSTWFIPYFSVPARIKFGYEAMSITDYVTMWTGYVESVNLSKESFSINLADTRKKLDVDIQSSWVDINAMTVIKEAIILAYPNVTYDDTYFDTVAWTLAATYAPNITVDMIDPMKATELIDAICASIFGIFFMTADGRYSFKVPLLDATCTSTIHNTDVIEIPTIEYNPSEVVSSVRVYCDIDYDLDTGEFATVVEDTTRKTYVFSTYSIYNSKEMTTYLPGTTAATVFASTFLDYTMDVHGTFEITVPMVYYTLNVGDTTYVEMKLENDNDFIGTPKCEIIGKTYNFDYPSIKFQMRIWYDEA